MLHITAESRLYLKQEAARSETRRRQRAAVAVRKKGRRLNADRFAAMVECARNILRTGEPTFFAFEGATRYGLRISLIEKGWSWQDADNCAAEIVATALRRLGATRPDHNEASPEHVMNTGTLRTFCAHCSRRIPLDRTTHAGNPVKYCSTECGQYAYAKKARFFGEKVSLAEYLARCAQRSEKTLRERVRDCEICARPFLSMIMTAKFCSRSCAIDAQRTDKRILCVGCGATFDRKHGNAQAKYCSHACYLKTATIKRTASCGVCSGIFEPRFSKARGLSKFCSAKCSSAAKLGTKASRPLLQCKACGDDFRPGFPSQKRSFCSTACNPYSKKIALASSFRIEEVTTNNKADISRIRPPI